MSAGAPEGGYAPLFTFSNIRHDTRTGYLLLPRGGAGGAGGIAKLPAWRRLSSSWFSWAALVPLIAEGGWAAIPLWCVEARPRRCVGGIADVVGPGPGAIAGGGAVCGRSVAGNWVPTRGGRLDIGEEGPGPPGRGAFGGGAPTPGPVRWADTGPANASAATIATPLKRCFMILILRCNSGLAEAYPRLTLAQECVVR